MREKKRVGPPIMEEGKESTYPTEKKELKIRRGKETTLSAMPIFWQGKE